MCKTFGIVVALLYSDGNGEIIAGQDQGLQAVKAPVPYCHYFQKSPFSAIFSWSELFIVK